MNDEYKFTLTIGDVSHATGLSVDTIRYYDRAGLIPLIQRTPSNHRQFAEEHLNWIALIDRLRASGMSIQRIKAYVALAVQGNTTIEQRRRLLQEHESAVLNRIAELQDGLAIVRAKLALYDGTGDMKRVREKVAAAQLKRITHPRVSPSA